MVCKNFFYDDKEILQNEEDGKLRKMSSMNGVTAINTSLFGTQDGAGRTMTGKCFERNDIGGEGGGNLDGTLQRSKWEALGKINKEREQVAAE